MFNNATGVAVSSLLSAILNVQKRKTGDKPTLYPGSYLRSLPHPHARRRGRKRRLNPGYEVGDKRHLNRIAMQATGYEAAIRRTGRMTGVCDSKNAYS